MRLLFQGDSITDAGRDRSDPHNLGNGYPRYAAALLRERFPEVKWEFLNQGVSGDRTTELLARWQKDCIDLQPDVFSIMIGTNDTWRAFDRNDPMAPEIFEKQYRQLLTDVREHTRAKILMIEQYVLPTGPDRECWRPDMDPKIQITRKLAREFADEYIPLDGLLAANCIHYEPKHWADDGVHPNANGAALIAGFYADAVARMLG